MLPEHTNKMHSVIAKMGNALLLLLFMLLITYRVAGQTFAGGTGTPADPYLIANVNQLQAIRNAPNSVHFKLINDIDASATATWNGGQGFNPIDYYNGTINGDGHTVSGLTINRPGLGQCAFTTHLGPAGIIKNITFEAINSVGGYRTAAIAGVSNGLFENVHVSGTIQGTGRVGGIVGEQYSNSTISDCHVDASVSGTGQDVGGLVGYCNNATINNSSTAGSVSGPDGAGGIAGHHTGTIYNCHSSSVVSGAEYVGGLAGYVNQGKIEKCYTTGSVSGRTEVGGLVGFIGWGSAYIKTCFSTASVTASGNQAGGLAGRLQGALLENSFARGTVSGNNRVGGLIGELLWGGNVVNCFSTGYVNGSAGQTGGLIGRLNGGSTSNSFWDTQTSGQNSSAGGTPRTTAQMLDINTFLNAGWDFTNIWTIDPDLNDGYPYLIPLGGFFMIIWTGSIDIAWEKPGNWNINAVPGSNDNVRIPNVANHPLITTQEAIKGMTIQPNGSVTIAHNGTLTITGNINNMAGTDGLLILSNAGGTGSLIHNNNGVQGSFQRFIHGEPEAWHMLSSPMASQPISPNFTPAGTYGDGTGYDFYLWHEPDTSWVYFLNDTYPPTWLSANGSNNFVPGKGYLISYQTTDVAKTFAGTLQNGTVSIGVTRTTGETAEFGNNLVGNPYPSSIDWKAATGWDRSMLESAGGGYDVWIWNDTANNYGVYNSASADDEGTLGVTRYIAPTQAFFVRVNQSGNLTMNNQVRAHEGSGNWIKRNAENKNKLCIKVVCQSGKGADEVMIEFGHEATGGAVKKFSFVETAPSLYVPNSMRNFSMRLLRQPDDHPVQPLAFKAGVNGAYTLQASFQSFAFETLILEDLRTGIRHNLLENPVYTFQADKNHNPARFVLHFREGNFANPHDALPAKIYSYNKTLYLDTRLLEPGTKCTLHIYDLTGRIIMEKNITCGGLKHIPMPGFSGIYIARLRNNLGTATQKLIF
jgi:hypothetical protein